MSICHLQGNSSLELHYIDDVENYTHTNGEPARKFQYHGLIHRRENVITKNLIQQLTHTGRYLWHNCIPFNIKVATGIQKQIAFNEA